MKSKEVQLMEAETRMVVTKGWGTGERDFVQRVKLPVRRAVSSGDLIHSMAIYSAQYCIIYLKELLRE